MNKEEFLERLEALLTGIPQEERIDALAFYRSYFEDAGAENEERVLQELESPEKVAASILGDALQIVDYADVPEAPRQKSNRTVTIVLAIIVAVLTSPIWISVLCGLLGVLIGLLGALLGITIAVIAVTAALWLVGFVLAGAGIVSLIAMPAVGLALIASGFIVLALAMLALLLTVLLFRKFVPWICKKIIGLCRKPGNTWKNRRERSE
jgi:uncharacterized membrane protein